ncbi:MAG: translation initiation factor IF-2 [Clostridia bacterium]|nr:translation initiation factor IF-2 [Clostridia bacterium]
MKSRYKVHEVAKDLGLKSPEVVAYLAPYFDGEKKYQTVLETEELDVLFEVVTLNNSYKNLDFYFANRRSAEERKLEKERLAAQKEAERIAREKQAEEERRKAAEEAERIRREEEAAAKAAEEEAKRKKKEEEAAKLKAKQEEEKRKADEASKNRKQADPQPFKKREKSSTEKPQPKQKAERVTVDTRQSNVELDKYNLRYDDMSVARGRNTPDQKKQKINQKSKQYRSPGAKSKKRETERERMARLDAERSKRHLEIELPEELTVSELAMKLRVPAGEVVKKLMLGYGIMKSVNQTIDYDTAEVVAGDFGAKAKREVVVTIEDRIIDDTEDAEENLIERDPVICVMGHVDHGKTSLLDAIRHTNVVAGESGGITQAIGAYRIEHEGRSLTFIDTPGHAAFTAMRARGAQATDIAVLVVAADDGIMPQTVEAINHAKAAEVSIIVAINKMDKPGANPDRIMQQLTEYDLVAEEWGGDVMCVPVSAKTGEGIDKLLEAILLVAEMRELKANPNRAAKGVVLEARLDKGRGPVATLLVQNGTLKLGDSIVAGTAVGKVRGMLDDKGRKVDSAGPAVPVEVMGLTEAPQAGDVFDAVSDDRLARELVEQRKQKAKDEANAVERVTLDNLSDVMAAGMLKTLNVIVKADVQGSVEAVSQNLVKLSNEEVRVSVVHGGVGAITESDVMLAVASNAVIVGFDVRPQPAAIVNAERAHIDIRLYRVIYDCIEDFQAAIKGMLAPKFRDVELGRAEVRQVFKLSSVGIIAGSYILDGKVSRNARIRVVRDGVIVAEDEIASLRRGKDDVKEVLTGFECGIGLSRFNDIKEGDVLEAFLTEEYQD